MPTLTLVRGLPGSGKTTWAKQNCSQIILEADMFFQCNGKYVFDARRLQQAHSWCKATAASCLSQGMDVTVCNTFSQLWEIENYSKDLDGLYNDLKVYCMRGDYGSVHEVPEVTIQKMKDRWEGFEGEYYV